MNMTRFAIRRFNQWLVCGLGLFFISLCQGKSHQQLHHPYSDNKKAQAFIASMSGRFGYTAESLDRIFAQVYRNDNILKKISRPAEKTTPWYRYRQIFLDTGRIQNGVAFYRAHQRILQQAYERYGVPPLIIVAIIGVESRYGRIMGSDKVIEALSTMAFDYPQRERFFTEELRAFLQMTAKAQLKPLELLGSYAGAMGMAQFMPSSYLRYAVDGDGDGKADLWHCSDDVIMSVANYLASHGWQRDGLIVDEAILRQNYAGNLQHKPFTTLGALRAQGVLLKHRMAVDDIAAGIMTLQGADAPLTWVTFDNFAVITTYNASPLYAMAVMELSQAIDNALW